MKCVSSVRPLPTAKKIAPPSISVSVRNQTSGFSGDPLHKSFISLAAATILSLTLLASSALFGRSWTSTDGKNLEATFVSQEGDQVTLKLSSGKTVTIPLNRLSDPDIAAARRFANIGGNSLTKASAARIDALLAINLKKAGQTSFNPPLSEKAFVRRLYLDIAGRIPTYEEFKKFTDDQRPDKREILIDDLLMGPGYASHLFNYFGDMYRLHQDDDFFPGVNAVPYHEWWRQQLEANVPYDEIVRKMITAEGNYGQNPASGFILRDTGMELDAFSNFSQVFLGIDISCAQCHDHPFEDWTRKDFLQMAAFFGQTQRRVYQPNLPPVPGGKRKYMPGAPEGWTKKFYDYAKNEKDVKPAELGAKFRFFVTTLGHNVTENEKMELLFPVDYQYSNGKPGEPVAPRSMIGKSIKDGGRSTSRRDAMATWLTSPENPRFAMVIANRMWSRAFGRALVEPANDFTDLSMSGQPEVLKFLATEMQRVGYDLREFMRILYNTSAYQTYGTDHIDDSKLYLFEGPVTRRMRAEQVWDSLLVLLYGDGIDEISGYDGSFYKEILDFDPAKETMVQVFDRYEKFKTPKPALKVIAEPGTMEARELDAPEFPNVRILRASEEQQPGVAFTHIANGWVLDTFGQSDRRITDQHVLDGSVPQVLSLMNGILTKRLGEEKSELYKLAQQGVDSEDKVNRLFFSVLSRPPSEEERTVAVQVIEKFGEIGVQDVIWSLLNNPEFLFVY